jgi:hypothetical protein
MEENKFRLPSEIPLEEWPKPEEFIEEAKDLVDAANKENLTIRIMGGMAIFLHSQNEKELWEKLGRLGKKVFTDIDLVGYGKHRIKLLKFFEQRGYTINQRLLYHYGKTRQIYYGPRIPMVEIFYDQLAMNHVIPYKNRLETDSPTLPAAELLLQKLQMVNMNEKDIKDSIILLRAHEIGDTDDNVINKNPLKDILCGDWGFFYTATKNLQKIKEKLSGYDVITPEDAKIVTQRIDAVLDYLENEPKTLKWKARAVVGAKKRWYNEVDDWDVIADAKAEE